MSKELIGHVSEQSIKKTQNARYWKIKKRKEKVELGDKCIKEALPEYICLFFWYHFACLWPTALILDGITNFASFFLVVESIYLIEFKECQLAVAICQPLGLTP